MFTARKDFQKNSTDNNTNTYIKLLVYFKLVFLFYILFILFTSDTRQQVFFTMVNSWQELISISRQALIDKNYAQLWQLFHAPKKESWQKTWQIVKKMPLHQARQFLQLTENQKIPLSYYDMIGLHLQQNPKSPLLLLFKECPHIVSALTHDRIYHCDWKNKQQKPLFLRMKDNNWFLDFPD